MTSLFEAAAEAGQPLETIPQRQPHIMIATPCHSGKVDINYHVSLLLAGAELARRGVNYTMDYNVGMSIDWARSQMATTFLKSDCTHLLFIDDDIAFAADLPYRMLCENVDIVAVPYRRKITKTLYNIRHGVRVKTIPDRPYMFAVDSIATGMMMIRRNVFEKLAPKVPEFLYDENGVKGRLFFRHELVDDEMVGGVSYMGEDYYFCKLARDNGFDIWAYADEDLVHVGQYGYAGKYSDFAEKGSEKKYSDDRPKLPVRVLLK